MKEREIDGREPMTLADINRLINSKYEANLQRNMSLTKGFQFGENALWSVLCAKAQEIQNPNVLLNNQIYFRIHIIYVSLQHSR